MVPTAFQGFFTSSSQIAGTVIGLLFVAISIAPDRVVGDKPSHPTSSRKRTAGVFPLIRDFT